MARRNDSPTRRKTQLPYSARKTITSEMYRRFVLEGDGPKYFDSVQAGVAGDTEYSRNGGNEMIKGSQHEQSVLDKHTKFGAPPEAVAAFELGRKRMHEKHEMQRIKAQADVSGDGSQKPADDSGLEKRIDALEEKLGSISLGTKTKPEQAVSVQRGPERLTRNMADPGVDAGKWLRKAIMDPRAELTTGGDGAGLVPEQVAQQIWFSLLGRISIVEAGAEIVRLPNGSFKVPKESTASTAHWLGETDEISDAATVFEDSGLEPHAVKALLSVSNEALQDSPAWSEQAIFRSLSDALVRAMNKAFLVGSGTSDEPEGIFEDGDVTETDLSGKDLAIDDVIEAYYDVLSKGGRAENMVMILNPHAASWMEKIRESSGDGTYLASSAGPFFRGTRWIVAEDAPFTSGSPDEADIIVADIRQAVQIVEFGRMRMQVDPSAGFSRDKTMFRTVSRLDVGIRYPELIHKLSAAQVSGS